MGIVLGIIAVVISIIALVIAIRKGKTIEVVREISRDESPTENPFSWDEKNKSYRLKGNLSVEGGICCVFMVHENKEV